MMEEDLGRIEVRLNAVLALLLERFIRDAGARDCREPRSPERILRDAGLSTSEIALLLGKSGRRVRKALEE
jgi:hypothetical protein